MTFNNNATKGILTKDIDSHTPFKHNRSLFGAPTRVRFFVTTAGAWKHSDLPAPVGATKKTSRFERMAFNASSWRVDEWLQECGLWVASCVSFRWRKLTLSFLIFREIILEECIAACHLHQVYHWHSWIPSEFTYCLNPASVTSALPNTLHPPQEKNILGYPGHDNFLCSQLLTNWSWLVLKELTPKISAHTSTYGGEACFAAKQLWNGGRGGWAND